MLIAERRRLKRSAQANQAVAWDGTGLGEPHFRNFLLFWNKNQFPLIFCSYRGH
jgi:hypothetical protein